MKTLALGVLAAIVIAILATIAVWSSVSDAPWEQEASDPIVVEDRTDEVEDKTDEIRCEGALRLREVLQPSNGSIPGIPTIPGIPPIPGFNEGIDVQAELRRAESEIDRYC